MSDAAGLLPRLEARLAALATQGRTTTYGALAAELAIPGPGSIAKLTAALETLMEADAAANRPLRAALCEARQAAGLPAPGFFDKAKELGFDVSNSAGFVAEQRAALLQSNCT